MVISVSNAVSVNKFFTHDFVCSSCAILFLVVATSKHVDLAIVDIVGVVLNRVCVMIFYRCFPDSLIYCHLAKPVNSRADLQLGSLDDAESNFCNCH